MQCVECVPELSTQQLLEDLPGSLDSSNSINDMNTEDLLEKLHSSTVDSNEEFQAGPKPGSGKGPRKRMGTRATRSSTKRLAQTSAADTPTVADHEAEDGS